MARLIHHGIRLQRRERGFAMIAIISLIVVMSTYLIANALNRASAELLNERERRSMDALRQAKAALIAYAASERWQLYKSQVINQPGALPCPTILNDDGSADCVGAGISSTSSLIGRLPWQALGTDDLRDASGERLWYALSRNFRKQSGTTVINSDTLGQLTVTGTAPASQIVAIVFAPGTAIQGQNRPASTTDPAHNNPVNYLEGFNLSDPVNYIFTTNALPSDTFNDRLIVITQADLMSAVEPVVAARIQRDIKPYLDTYLATWHRYPFAALFPLPGNPTDYQGVSGQESGLLPLTADPTFVAWQSPLATVVSASPAGSITNQDCTTSSTTQIDCTVTYSGAPTLSFSLVASKVGMAIVRAHAVGDLTVTSGGVPLAPSAFSTANALLPNGDGTVFLALAMPASASPVRIQIPRPPYNELTVTVPPSGSNAYWFVSNQWYKQAFYAVAPDLMPGGGGNCGTTPPCLTVNNLSAPNNNIQAIVILAGRYLNSSARPSPAGIADYLEGANLTGFTTTPYVYEHRAGLAGLSCAQFLTGTCPVPNAPYFINDRVVVVAP